MSIEEVLKKSLENQEQELVLRKELEDTYFDGFVKGYWDLEYEQDSAFLNDDVFDLVPYGESIEKLETTLYNTTITTSTVILLEEFQAAKKRWDEVKASPLYQALL